ncbi:hypothetical protein LSH36_206g00065 [Paralvinella palmiformis]|uniref:Uncharacterized protein n=1 Tax=Paralvinella palmiformis TaxID=53620 RepID=A0AAD9JNX8_9ANNE|nr:hypothetical protein LSH36_206g00065 [Paralvinella palmiformis]
MFLAPKDPREISRLIESLKCKNSSEHDGIISLLSKDIKLDISFPLTILINKSVKVGIIHDLLKTTNAIPIYTAKDKEQFNNYRPFSLVTTIPKLIDKN